MAGFQVIIGGRFWVITEARNEPLHRGRKSITLGSASESEENAAPRRDLPEHVPQQALLFAPYRAGGCDVARVRIRVGLVSREGVDGI